MSSWASLLATRRSTAFVVWREYTISAEKSIRLNEQITALSVRLIGADGEQAGVVPVSEALQIAEDANLDLVEISPNADPPVCRVMDYGKFRYTANKKKHEAKKKQKQISVKEVKFRPGTDVGDYEVKLRNLIRFLSDGNKTKVTLRFRGREMAHQELGLEMLKRVESDLDEIGIVEQYPKMEGRQMVMVIAPRR
ncbi:MAG: translation initiation factor IF-3 [Gammaproteobacteria bacterium]|nr:translation initiation factor IF-3 [Gammaproteobacteria bacterium]MDH3464944.1 translation initiation factor IF-3 [Gammaproteobacteria bacterium]